MLTNNFASFEAIKQIIDTIPLVCVIVDEEYNIHECNQEVVNLFGISDKQFFVDKFFDFSPMYQPDGRLSRQKAHDKLKQAFEAGRVNYEWLYQSFSGEHIPCETTIVKFY